MTDHFDGITMPFEASEPLNLKAGIDADVMAKAQQLAMGAVNGMCLTWRHDYGLMDPAQADGLRRSMEQIAYHDVSKVIARAIQAERDANNGLRESLKEIVRILDAVKFQAGLGKSQLDRLHKAKGLLDHGKES